MANKPAHIKRQLVEALEDSMGVVTLACRKVGCSRWAFYEYMKTDPEFKSQVDELQNVALDFAEAKLQKLINDENPAAIIFFLKTKGKHRGYIETQQHQIQGLAKIEFVNVSETYNGILEDQTPEAQDQDSSGRPGSE